VASSKRAWLDHLRVMGELPYPSLALMPSISALVRDRLNAVLVSFGWVHGAHLEPEAFWVDRIHESAFRWFKDNYAAVFAEAPFRLVIQSDGEAIRQLTERPEYVDNPAYTHVLSTYGARWMCCLPFAFAHGERYGFLYLYRAEAQAKFSDDDLVLLRRVRDALGPLDRGASLYRDLPPAPRHAVARASMVFDRNGRLLSRGSTALPLLFLANGPGIDVLDWAGFDIQVLPEPIRADAQAWMRSSAGRRQKSWTVSTTWGTFEFAFDPMDVVAGAPGVPQWLMTVTYLEPLDLTLARRLSMWSLAPQEKRILIASTRDVGIAEIAGTIGVTVGSAKNYINGMLQRFDASSRSDLVATVLDTMMPGDPLVS
jgi:DNA-binding CsgD family transcriptional regulator